ncbi:MAG: thiamine phosphate synthase [Taibaiella sp.]|nr:thiamine phosphate synthase [Taibaiella sp.]
MNIVVITTDKHQPNEHDIIHSLFAEGLQRLHVRKPNLALSEVRSYIEQIDRSFRNRLVIHRHHELHREFGLGGVHISSFDRANPTILTATSHLPPDSVSTSIHAWNELKDLPFTCSYVFISPVFDSISKPGYNAGIDLHELSRIKSGQKGNSAFPGVYGLGGINATNIGILEQHGFDGAAVLGSIWMEPDPVAAFRKLRCSIGEKFS